MTAETQKDSPGGKLNWFLLIKNENANLPRMPVSNYRDLIAASPGEAVSGAPQMGKMRQNQQKSSLRADEASAGPSSRANICTLYS